jgi:hypothetical protein
MTYYYRLTIFILLACCLEFLQLQAGVVITLPIATWLVITALKGASTIPNYQVGLISFLSIVWGILFATNWGILIVWYLLLLFLQSLLVRFVSNELINMGILLVIGLAFYILIFNLEFGFIATPLQLLISALLALFLRNFLDDSVLHNYDRKYRI